MAIFLSFTVVNYLNVRRVIHINEFTDKINFFTLFLIAQLPISIFKIWNKVHSVNFTNRFWVTLPRYLHLKMDRSDKNNQHFFRRGFVTSHASSQILSIVSNHQNRIKIRGTQRQFSEISVRKTIWDLEFSNICCKISCLPASPRIFEDLKNGIIAYF